MGRRPWRERRPWRRCRGGSTVCAGAGAPVPSAYGRWAEADTNSLAHARSDRCPPCGESHAIPLPPIAHPPRLARLTATPPPPRPRSSVTLRGGEWGGGAGKGVQTSGSQLRRDHFGGDVSWMGWIGGDGVRAFPPERSWDAERPGGGQGCGESGKPRRVGVGREGNRIRFPTGRTHV